MDDRCLAESGHTAIRAGPQSLDQQPKVCEVTCHGGGVVEVGKVLLCLPTTPTRPVALKQVVVGEDRHVVMGGSALSVVERKLPAGVPGGPSAGRVHASR